MRVKSFVLTDGEQDYEFNADFMSERTADRIVDLINAWKNRAGSA